MPDAGNAVNVWRGQSVLVTGASGLVGSHLVARLLEEGAAVTVLLRDHDLRSELFRSGSAARVSIVNGTLERYADVERAVAESEAEAVFHLGAQTIVGVAVDAPLATFESNVRGTYNVIEACRRGMRHVQRVVIASSDKAYGASSTPYREDDPLRPTAPYDASKSAGDLLAFSYAATYDLPLAIIRCGNTFGGGDLNWSRLVPGTIRSFLAGESPQIRSDGTFVRDYIYVSDVVEAYVRTAAALPRGEVAGGAFNFASGVETSVLDMVRAVGDTIGGTLPEPRVLGVAKNEIREQRLSIEKAKRVLDWKPRVTLREGLRETVGWYRGFLRGRD